MITEESSRTRLFYFKVRDFYAWMKCPRYDVPTILKIDG